jgi:DNA-binding winged helix-turn-helix (wHTH) protein/Tol biopolymer transport system component
VADRYRFDDVEIDTQSFRLLKAGKVVQVEPKTLHLLIFLIENRSRLLARREIIDAVWHEAFVTDHVLNRSIGQLRKGLGDDAREPRYIETVPTLGYRFIAQVERQPEHENGAEALNAPSLGESVAFEDLTGSRTNPAGPPVDNGSAAQSPKLPFQGRVLLTRPLLLAIVATGFLAAGFLLQHALSRHQKLRYAITHPAIEQRITSNPPDAPIEAASVSPDGKYLAYSDVTGLYLRDIASGETRPWGVPKNFIANPNTWFPDGTHLLVTRMEGVSRKPSLWKLSLLGGTPRMLMDNAAAGSVSPDGSQIAYLPGSKLPEATPDVMLDIHEVGTELWLMDSEGANPHKIVAVEKATETVSDSRIRSVTWSPRGQRIAYIERHNGLALSDPTIESFSLRTRDAEGGNPQVVLNDALLEPALSWVADGRILYTYSEDPASERGDQGIRSIQADERTGKATGQPQLVTHGQGRIGGLSATSDGERLVLWRKNTESQAFISEFEAGSRRLKSPRRLTLDANGNLAEAWTPDSKAIFFVSNRNGTWKLFRQAIDETTAEVLVEGRSLFLPRLSADGTQILYLAYAKPKDPSPPVALMRVPPAGGPPQFVLQAPGITNHQCASFPSQLCIFSRQTGADNTFLSFDTEHGIGRELTKTDHFTNWSLSRDGSKLVIFLNDHQLRFFGVNTNIIHDVTVKDWPLDNGDWSADGKSILMPSVTTAGIPVILDVDEAGKAAVILQGTPNTSFRWLVSSPDGRFGILEADVPGDNNVWMVENF